MSDAITLLIGPKALTDEQLSEALSVALATALCHLRVKVDPPEFVRQLLAEYKQRHARPRRGR